MTPDVGIVKKCIVPDVISDTSIESYEKFEPNLFFSWEESFTLIYIV